MDINRAREWVNQNSAAVTVGAVVILIFALAYLWFQNQPQGGNSRSSLGNWYYDVQTGETFASENQDLPPIIRENGNKAFKAYLFTCGSCAESERFVGYYEGYTEEYKQKRQKAMEAAKATDSVAMPDEIMYMEEGFSKGRLVSTDGKVWVTSNSPEGAAINVALSKACDEVKDGRLKPCYPGSD